MIPTWSGRGDALTDFWRPGETRAVAWAVGGAGVRPAACLGARGQADFGGGVRAKAFALTPPGWRCLGIPGGDGGGFHVAKGKQGASWNPATSRPGTWRG